MDKTLQHYGIPGMKWGVRRSEAQLARARGKKSWSDDAKEAKKIKKKKVNQMSNSELKKVNERVRLEQEYSRLNPKTVKKGMNAVAKTAVATTTVLTLYNNADKLIAIGKKFMKKG